MAQYLDLNSSHILLKTNSMDCGGLVDKNMDLVSNKLGMVGSDPLQVDRMERIVVMWEDIVRSLVLKIWALKNSVGRVDLVRGSLKNGRN